MDGTSLNIAEEQLKKLLESFPEVITDGKVDWEKLKITLGENIELSNERYVLNWAGKSDAFRVLQEPSYSTLLPVKDESIDFDKTENIFIEGENMEVLKVLQKSYFGEIKMIYIDPPYNTGSDSFIYPDKFAETKEEYQKRIGEKDEEGYMTREGMFRKNSKENGQYHSNWLSMMYPRLFLAKNLLKSEGVIFVSIDDNELYNLKLLMNEVFGEENYIGTIIWKNATDNNPTQVAIEHEYLLVYGKNKVKVESEWKSSVSDVKQILVNIGNKLINEHKELDQLKAAYGKWFKENKAFLWPMDRYKHIDFDGVYIGSQSVHNPGKEGYRYDVIHPETQKPCKQPLMGYRFPKETMDKLLEDDKILFGEDETKIIELKVYAKDFQDKLPSVIELDGRVGSYDLKTLFPGTKRLFNNPKPVRFLDSFFPFGLKDGDILLDFFAGSCSSAHTVLGLNHNDGGKRRFICSQLPEKCKDESEAQKLGYTNIAQIGKERIRKVIQAIREKSNGELEFKENDSDLGFKVFKLTESNFKIWQNKGLENDEALSKQMDAFVDPVAGHAQIENMVFELILKSGLSLNSTISKEHDFYNVNEGKLILILESVSEQMIKRVLELKAEKVIALDKLFQNNDQLKTNTALQLKDAGVDFKTI